MWLVTEFCLWITVLKACGKCLKLVNIFFKCELVLQPYSAF